MLLRSDSQLMFSLYIHLFFDDGKEKDATFNKGDYCLLKIRRNNSKYNIAGQIIGIDPIMINCHPNPEFTAHLIVDCARRFKSARLRVPVEDVLDFRIVSREHLLDLYPDYIITDDMFVDSSIPDTPDHIYEAAAINYGGIDFAGVY